MYTEHRSKTAHICLGCSRKFYPFSVSDGKYCTLKCYWKHRLSHEEVVKRFWKNVTKSKKCWTWNALRNDYGYGLFPVGRSHVRAHRFSWALANKKDPGKMIICHKCDNPPCVRPSHLFIGTHLDNQLDCITKGRRPNTGEHRGEANGNTHITNDEVKEIREQYACGMSQKSIGILHGMTQAGIHLITSRKTWKHI